LRLDDSGEIGYVPRGLDFLDVVGACDGGHAQYEARDTKKQDGNRAFHAMDGANVSMPFQAEFSKAENCDGEPGGIH
jgi:hypothetical protein